MRRESSVPITQEEIDAKRKARAAKKAQVILSGGHLDFTQMNRVSAETLYTTLKSYDSKIPVVFNALKKLAQQMEQADRDAEDTMKGTDDEVARFVSSNTPHSPVHIDFEPTPFNICHRNLRQPRYLWVLNEVRDFFRENAFWPSFIGSRIDYEVEVSESSIIFVYPCTYARIHLFIMKAIDKI